MLTNLILAVGSTVLMAAPVNQELVDLSSFVKDLSQARETLVRAAGQYAKAYRNLKPEQKAFLLRETSGKNHGKFVTESFPQAYCDLDNAIIDSGGKTMTEQEFSDICQQEVENVKP